MEELQKLQKLITKHREIQEEISKTKDAKKRASLNRQLKKITTELYGSAPEPEIKEAPHVTKPQEPKLKRNEFVLIKESGGLIKNYRIAGLSKSESYHDCISAAKGKVLDLLEEKLKTSPIKYSTVIHCRMFKPVTLTATDALDDEREIINTIDQVAYFRSSPKTIMNNPEIEEQLDLSLSECESQLDEFTNNGSGWILEKVLRIDVETAVYNPFKGASYIPTPDFIPKGSVVNVRNDDNRCFMYAVLASLFPPTTPVGKNNISRPGLYKKYIDSINLDGITYPVAESYYKTKSNISPECLWD